MGWVSGIAVYIIIWWTVIFLILPWGFRPVSAGEVSKGHASSAPQRPRILAKTAVTTLVAAVIWLIVYAVIESGAISFTS